MGIMIKLFIEDVRKELNITVWSNITNQPKTHNDDLANPIATFVVPLFVNTPNQCNIYKECSQKTNDVDCKLQNEFNRTIRQSELVEKFAEVDITEPQNVEQPKEYLNVSELLTVDDSLYSEENSRTTIDCTENCLSQSKYAVKSLTTDKPLIDDENSESTIDFNEDHTSENSLTNEYTESKPTADLKTNLANRHNCDDTMSVISDDYTLEIEERNKECESIEEDLIKIEGYSQPVKNENVVNDNTEIIANSPTISSFGVDLCPSSPDQKPISVETVNTKGTLNINKTQHNKRKFDEGLKSKTRNCRNVRQKQSQCDTVRTEDQNYFCKPCRKSFIDKQSLKQHLTRKSCFARLRSCEYCGKLYFSDYLRRHIKRFHKVEAPQELANESTDDSKNESEPNDSKNESESVTSTSNHSCEMEQEMLLQETEHTTKRSQEFHSNLMQDSKPCQKRLKKKDITNIEQQVSDNMSHKFLYSSDSICKNVQDLNLHQSAHLLSFKKENDMSNDCTCSSVSHEYCCSVCQYTCENLGDLHTHEETHNIPNKFSCRDSDYTSIKKQGLLLHKKIHAEKKKRGILEDKSSTDRVPVRAYARIANQRKQDIEKQFSRTAAKETSTQEYQCTFCTYACSSKKRLLKHRNKSHHPL